MTNKEILQADVLDIIFENRNKGYGAYALRRGYDKRLLTALASALSAIAIVAIMLGSAGKREISSVTAKKKEIVELREINLPKEKPKEIEKPKEQPKQPEKQKPVVKVQPVAKEKFVSKIVIKPDDMVKEKLPVITDLGNKQIGDEKTTGKPDDGKPVVKQPVVINGGGTGTEKTETGNVFNAVERNAEFPGGAEALKKFLASNLQTPGDLEGGEKKTVLIRFKVDKDGSVNTFEIVTSGGSEFDREVVRVCRKMPRWMPAFQNGMNVPVNYMLPVTFIGLEQ